MKKLIFAFIALNIFLCACNESSNNNSKPSREQLKTRIKEMEDSINTLQQHLSVIKKIPNLTHFELVNRLLDYYHNYPEDAFAAECLDKVHMKFAGLNIPTKAAEFADTLLLKYPKYANRAMVLESQGSTYDIFILPRDTVKVRYYYELLLKENRDMDKEKRAGIRDRLDHLDMTFDEFINYKMNAITVK
jgi:hypothetical protein